MNFQLVLIRPEGFDFVESFREVMEVLQEGLTTLGHTVTICTNQVEPHAWPIIFGAHHLDAESVDRLPAQSVIYNLEQLVPGYPWFSEAYLQLLGRFQVWDYSSQNIDYLSRAGRTCPLVYLPFGYSPCLSRIKPIIEEDVDVLFFGVHTERRLSALTAIAERGLNVVCLRDVWGTERDAWIARAKVVVAIRQTDGGRFEDVRVIFLLANAKAVVSETLIGEVFPVPLQGALCAAAYDELVDACERLVGDANERAALRHRAIAAAKAELLQALPWISRAVGNLVTPGFDDHLRNQLYGSARCFR